MKRIASMILILGLLAALLSGCGGQTAAAPADTEAPVSTETPAETEAPAEPEELQETEETEAPAEAAQVFNFAEAEAAFAPETTVMTIGNTPMDWTMYYGSIHQVLYELNSYYGISDLTQELQEGLSVADWVKGWTEDYLTQLVMLHSKAAELEITLSEEDLAAIDQDIETQAETYFEGDKEALFEAMQIPEVLFRYQAEAALLYDKLFAHFFGEDGSELSEADAVAYVVDSGYLYAKHILWSFTDDEGNELSDEEKDAKRAQAREVLDELRATAAGELDSAFDRMMEHYTEDPGLTSYPDGYYFQTGQMVAVFEDAAMALAEGELSELVESDYGVHLLYRPAMHADHVFQYDSSGSSYTLRTMAANGLFSNMCDEWMTQQTVQYAEGFQDLDLTQLFSFSA